MRANSTLVLIAITYSSMGSAQSTASGAAQKDPKRAVWIDSSTGLMWAGMDNGKDISWRSAMKYCQALRLDGHSDWRLASLAELQGIYDERVEVPGLAGYANALRPFTWHVKGNLFLTGDHWIGREVTGRMPLESYEYHFDFNSGKSKRDPTGWPYPSSGMRALCVRGPD